MNRHIYVTQLYFTLFGTGGLPHIRRANDYWIHNNRCLVQVGIALAEATECEGKRQAGTAENAELVTFTLAGARLLKQH